MKIRQRFWKAFFEGLAAPSLMYAPIPDYASMIRGFDVGSNFAAVGALITKQARKPK